MRNVGMKAMAVLFVLGATVLLNSCGGSSATTTPPSPAISVSPSSVNFANQTVGTTSAPQTITVTNTGTATLNISTVGVIPQQFRLQSGSLQQSLAPGASATYTVVFAPTSATTLTGQLTITSDAPTSPTVVSLSGTGTSSTTVPGASVSPIALDFGDQVQNTVSPPTTVTVMDTGTASINVTSVNLTGPFSVSGFSQTITLAPGQTLPLAVSFAPVATGSLTGGLTVSTTASSSPLTVALSGTGTSTPAAISVSPASITFGNFPVGQGSPLAIVTITNTGTNLLIIQDVAVPDPFAFSGLSAPFTLSSGQQLQLPVSFTPAATGSATATLGIFSSTVTTRIVSLAGSGIAVNSLTVTTASPLPAGTQNAAYSAVLRAFGGTPPYTWGVASGSHMPPGLALGTDGTISGSTNTSSTGDFPFIVQVTDSATPPAVAFGTLTVLVEAPTGGNCNGISSGSPPYVPLNDLGTGTYENEEGGLYPNGTNTDPSTHQTTGVNLANSVQSLDSNGNPSASGLEVMVSIGMSNALLEFHQFLLLAGLDTSVNRKLLIVNGAQTGFGALAVSDPTDAYWSNLVVPPNGILPATGVSCIPGPSPLGYVCPQVQVAWVKEALPGPPSSETFLQYAASLQADLEGIARNLHTYFPNIKLAYFTSRIYGGYAATPENPEPFAYWSGFSVKWAIQDQLNGLCSVNFEPTQCGGTVAAPWMAWGPYPWINGMTPRSDGLVWACQDLESDGTHPAIPGRQKVANLLLNFFKTDTTATPWFLAH